LVENSGDAFFALCRLGVYKPFEQRTMAAASSSVANKRMSMLVSESVNRFSEEANRRISAASLQAASGSDRNGSLCPQSTDDCPFLLVDEIMLLSLLHSAWFGLACDFQCWSRMFLVVACVPAKPWPIAHTGPAQMAFAPTIATWRWCGGKAPKISQWRQSMILLC
jgi:hypothetical protein